MGIKLNAGDYILGGISEAGAFEHVRQISLLEVDFIEISGGDYENPSEAYSFSLCSLRVPHDNFYDTQLLWLLLPRAKPFSPLSLAELWNHSRFPGARLLR